MSFRFVFPEIDGPALSETKDHMLMQLLIDAMDQTKNSMDATKYFINTSLNSTNIPKDEIITFLTAYLMGYILEKHDSK